MDRLVERRALRAEGDPEDPCAAGRGVRIGTQHLLARGGSVEGSHRNTPRPVRAAADEDPEQRGRSDPYAPMCPWPESFGTGGGRRRWGGVIGRPSWRTTPGGPHARDCSAWPSVWR